MRKLWRSMFKREGKYDSFSLMSQLPDEIILEIINLLNQVDVLSLMNVNQRLYQLGLTKLYHSIYLNGSPNIVNMAISSHVYASFHIKWTIVKSVGKFIKEITHNKNIHLIREILSNSLQPDGYEVIESLPWFSFRFEYDLCTSSHLNRSLVASLSLTPENYEFLQDNDATNNVKKITIRDDTDLFDIISKLNLKSLQISPLNQEVNLGLSSQDISNLPIRDLFPKGCVSNDLLHEVNNIFNLEMIETLGISLTGDALFPCLSLHRLHNLKLLFLHNGSCCYKATKLIPYDSLRFLCLHDKDAKRYNFFDYNSLVSFIGTQEKSLTKLCLSSGVIYYMRHSWIDKVYKCNHEVSDTDNIRNLHLIDQILKGNRFPNLYTIILNGIYYLIKRYGTDIKIITL